MLIDAQLLLWDAAAISGTGAGSVYSTNTIDLSNVTPKRDIGTGENMALVIQVDAAADFTSGDETYEFQFVQSVNANLSSHDNLISRTILASALTIGSIHIIPIPHGVITKRYIGARFVGAGTTWSITVTSWLAPVSLIQKDKHYADAITIS